MTSFLIINLPLTFVIPNNSFLSEYVYLLGRILHMLHINLCKMWREGKYQISLVFSVYCVCRMPQIVHFSYSTLTLTTQLEFSTEEQWRGISYHFKLIMPELRFSDISAYPDCQPESILLIF